MSNTLPLTRLTFIPKKVRSQLRRRGLVTTSDLLRCATLALRESLGKSTTIADVRSWQAVCSVLEIEGMSLPWAWALSQRGIVAARDFGQRALSQASAVFAEARRRGDIALVPTADALVAMMLDSVRIRLGGLLNATVEGRGHKALAGARVVCAAVEGITDSHGRVRLLRLPLGQRVDVRIEKAGYAEMTSTLAGLHGVQVIEGHHFSLKRSPKRRIARALSEFKGDVLANLTGERIHPIEVRNQPLRVGDVVRFFERLQRGDAKLVSVFKAVESGRIIAPVWRIAANTLPPKAQIGDTFKVTREGLERTECSSRQLARLRVARQVAAELKKLGKPKTPAQAHRRLDKGIKTFLAATRTLRGS